MRVSESRLNLSPDGGERARNPRCDCSQSGLTSQPTPVPSTQFEPDRTSNVDGTSFATSLEGDEISVALKSTDLIVPEPHIAHEECSSFRHSGWKRRRRLTLKALTKADVAESSIDRFVTCGERAWILQSSEQNPNYRLAVNRCRNRWCIPCATEQRNVVQANVIDACKEKDLRFITLTLKAKSRGLREQLATLRRSFKRLRQRKATKSALKGGIYFIEVTRNQKSRQWHPHLHIITEGTYVPHEILKREWLDITKDSYIVDIRKLKDSRIAAGYISKYAGKPISSKIVEDTESFAEVIIAFHGSRTFSSFGTWKNLGLSKPPESSVEYKPLMPLSTCIIAARKGNAACRHILKRLSRSYQDATYELEPGIPP